MMLSVKRLSVQVLALELSDNHNARVDKEVQCNTLKAE